MEYRTHTGSIPEQTHVRLRRDTSQSEWLHRQPLFVTYTNDRRIPRTKRRAKHKKRSRNYRRRKDNTMCRRHELYVNFTSVGWEDWIIAPAGYDSYFCHGVCQWPFPQGSNTTNHAIVQSLLHSADNTKVPEPCCIPTELGSLPLLYIDNGAAVLKTYEQMVVQGCGCR